MRSERRAYPRDRLWMQLSEGAKLGQTSPGCFSRRPLLGASDLREPLLDARVELLEPCLELLSRGIGEALQYLLEAREARVIDMLRELESLVRELDALGAAIIRITLERDVSCSFHLLAQARHVGFVDPQKIDKVRERGALARELGSRATPSMLARKMWPSARHPCPRGSRIVRAAAPGVEGVRESLRLLRCCLRFLACFSFLPAPRVHVFRIISA